MTVNMSSNIKQNQCTRKSMPCHTSVSRLHVILDVILDCAKQPYQASAGLCSLNMKGFTDRYYCPVCVAVERSGPCCCS